MPKPIFEFGSDELGKVLNESVRLTKPFDRVYMVQPYNEIYPRTHKGAKPLSARTNAFLIIQAARRMAKAGEIQTVIWDGFSNLARSVKNEVAHSGVNTDENTKNMMTQWGDDRTSVLNTPGVNWRDYGVCQEFLRNDFRNPLLSAPEPFNLLMLGHEVLNENEGEYGPDAGGPKSWNFGGGVFEGVFWVGKLSGTRVLAIEDFKRGAHTVKATLKKSPDKEVGQKGFIKIPDTYEGSVGVWNEILAAQSSPLTRVCIYGGYDGGKSALSSAFLGTKNAGTVLVIMNDQQLGLPTWWPEAKEKK